VAGADLLTALAALDVDAVDRALGAIQAHDVAAAAQLSKLAESFQYERMTALLSRP
jgi:hypothetical protein